MKIYAEKIIEIIESKEFKKNLESDYYNFPNQKLEFHIRNNIVKIFNSKKKYLDRAFAEHPRYKYKINSKNKRVSVDFSICSKTDVKFTMEIKYNFTNDDLRFEKYGHVIEKNFVNRIWNEKDEKIHAFLLIICETDRTKLKNFQEKWNTNDMLQYQTKRTENIWKNNIDKVFNEKKQENNCILLKTENEIITDELSSNFYYYLLCRKKTMHNNV